MISSYRSTSLQSAEGFPKMWRMSSGLVVFFFLTENWTFSLVQWTSSRKRPKDGTKKTTRTKILLQTENKVKRWTKIFAVNGKNVFSRLNKWFIKWSSTKFWARKAPTPPLICYFWTYVTLVDHWMEPFLTDLKWRETQVFRLSKIETVRRSFSKIFSRPPVVAVDSSCFSNSAANKSRTNWPAVW